MNPFRYPEGRHIRTQDPGPFRDYRHYKPFLRLEFHHQCVYCRMPEGFRGEDAFGVDHYRPRKRFPALLCEYANLFYSCNACNRRKGSFWPDGEEWSQGLFIPNPCDHIMAEHLTFDGTRVEAKTGAGQIALELLRLNDPEDIRYRDFLLRSIERCLSDAECMVETLSKLESLLPKARGPELEALQHELALARADFIQVQDDLERLTGLRLLPRYNPPV